MIRVLKNSEPDWLLVWKQQETSNWKPLYDNLREKDQLRADLLKEQGGLCCYCGREASEDCHIEHFRPQSKFHGLEMDYGNLHVSCIKKLKLCGPLHCGHAKGDKFDENLCISPLEEDCEERFLYTAEGEILPKDAHDERAKYMIDILNLNESPLVGRRKEMLTRTLPPEFLDEMSSDELRKLREAYQTRGANGNDQEFRQVLSCYIDQNLPIAN